MEPCSKAVGEFVRGLKLADVPPGVAEKSKLVFLDTLGVALASSTMDFGQMVLNVARKLGGASDSCLIGTSSKVTAANAVLANGTLAHGLDYDDTLEEAIVHTGCCAVVTALAVGEEVGSGIIEYLADGSWTKRFHPGWSAHGGVIATLLARQGFRGPATVFEGQHGFYRSFGGANEYRFEKLFELGRVWETPRLTFKSYPCGSISHPYMDCALRLRQKHSLLPERIVEVVCRTAEGPVHRLWEPLEQKQRPSTSYGAKFSLPYSIAVILVRGRAGLEEFSEHAIGDPQILDLARKVRYELDPTIDYPRHFSGHVRIKLDDGSVLEENQPHPRGGLESPLPPEEIEEKFRANARLALPQERVNRIVDSVRQMEQLGSITALSDLLSP